MLPNNFFSEERDRWLYRSIRRLFAASPNDASNVDDPTCIRSSSSRSSARVSADISAVLANFAPNVADPTVVPSNRTLRLRLLHVETTIEIICTVVASFIILSFGISLNGHDPPTVKQVLLNAAIQLIAECAQSLGCMLYYIVITRQPAMSLPLIPMRGFSLVIAIISASAWCDCLTLSLPVCLGRRADSGTNWIFTSEAFVNEFNTSALCAAFPEAVGFAKERC